MAENYASGFHLKSKYNTSTSYVQKPRKIPCRYENNPRGCLNPNCLFTHQRARKNYVYEPCRDVANEKEDNIEGKENIPDDEKLKLMKVFKESSSIYKSVYDRPTLKVKNATHKKTVEAKKSEYADTLENHMKNIQKLRKEIEILGKRKYKHVDSEATNKKLKIQLKEEKKEQQVYNITFEEELDYEPDSAFEIC